MADLAELFPGIDLGSAPKNGGCSAPSTQLTMLSGLRMQLSNGFADITLGLRRIENDVARNADSLADLAEALDQLRVRLTRIERAAGVIETPVISRQSRKRPLG